MKHITIRTITKKTPSQILISLTTSLSTLLSMLSSMSLSKDINRSATMRYSDKKQSLIVVLALMAFPNFVFSADVIEESTEKTLKTYSMGQSISESNNPTQQQILATLKKSIALDNNDQLQKKLTNISRDEIINGKILQAQFLSSNRVLSENNVAITSDLLTISNGAYFVVYEGYSALIEDKDGDGYYQSFSVTFDVDLVSYNPYDEAMIYAELYLSENGGPWEHYYTTGNFVIMGENSADTFEVYSTLGEGFNPSHYDVLIDIYEVNSPVLMASYSSENSNGLYALPLESHYSDLPYIEYSEEIYIQGGSYSMPLLFLLSFILLLRQFRCKEIIFK